MSTTVPIASVPWVCMSDAHTTQVLRPNDRALPNPSETRQKKSMTHDPQIAVAVTEIIHTLQTAARLLETLSSASAASSCASGDQTRSKKAYNHNPWKKFSARWSDVDSDWPQIGGRRFVSAPPDIFLGDEYRAVYRPGDDRSLYAGDCDGLTALNQRFRLPTGKVSSCEGGRLGDRLIEIGVEEYAAVCLLNGQEVDEPGFRRWRTLRPPVGLTISPNSPVRVEKECLVVRIPDQMTWREFDLVFDEKVRLGSISQWVETDAGLLHCEKVGANPEFARRYTRRAYDTGTKCERATEIVCFRSRSDFKRIVQIAERVVLEFLGLV